MIREGEGGGDWKILWGGVVVGFLRRELSSICLGGDGIDKKRGFCLFFYFGVREMGF